MADTIQKILDDAAKKNIVFNKTAESMKWFRERARRTTTSSSKLIREYGERDLRNRSQLQIGRMYMYFYDPKHKKTLPYYDRFPCIFLTDMYEDGWAGINLHYLPYKQRAFLMDALYDLEGKKRSNEVLKISYGILKSAATNKWFRPTYKRYLKNHVRSKLVNVPYEEWPVAAFLPVQEFEKATAQQVWAKAARKSK